MNLLKLLGLVSDIITAFEGVKPRCVREDINIVKIELEKSGRRVGVLVVELTDEDIKRAVYDRVLKNLCST
jgi:hypothetical protein